MESKVGGVGPGGIKEDEFFKAVVIARAKRSASRTWMNLVVCGRGCSKGKD